MQRIRLGTIHVLLMHRHEKKHWKRIVCAKFRKQYLQYYHWKSYAVATFIPIRLKIKWWDVRNFDTRLHIGKHKAHTYKDMNMHRHTSMYKHKNAKCTHGFDATILQNTVRIRIRIFNAKWLSSCSGQVLPSQWKLSRSDMSQHGWS